MLQADSKKTFWTLDISNPTIKKSTLLIKDTTVTHTRSYWHVNLLFTLEICLLVSCFVCGYMLEILANV